VEFAGPFRSFGQMLIINPGQDYLIVLAGLESVSVERGQSVSASDPLGFMGKQRSSAAFLGEIPGNAKEAGNSGENPVLYVEFRKNGSPIDSASWWTGNKKEAKR
jgi:murein hydrolase activator